MNQEKADKLIKVAKRTIKIVELLMAGTSKNKIVELVGANRQLVDYYEKQLTNKI